MTDSLPLRDRYLQLIDQIVQTTLKGQIRSKEQVYKMLVKDVTPGTGEIFERVLEETLSATQQQVDTQKDEMKLAKATRTLRAMQTIRGEWERAQEKNRATDAIATAVQQIIASPPDDKLAALLRVIDPNLAQALNLPQLASALKQQAPEITHPEQDRDVQQLAEGLARGLESWQRLEGHLVSWIYDQNRSLGFEGTPAQSGPWGVWEKQVNSPYPQALFHALALNESVTELVAKQPSDLISFVELAVILQYLQRGLVNWFDKLVYDSKVGARLSISTFLTFAVIWSQLANGLNQATILNSTSRDRLVNGCFQITLQILRTFSQRQYFPLYGGIFASFSGAYLRTTLDYLDAPLRQVEGTQEKARILTLMGYSQRAQGRYADAIAFHEQALEIARNAGDRPCEIANFNHLSRTCVAQKNYAEAISYSQRALILSRQTGDRLGEANALANLGYSEVFQAQQLEQIEPEIYETAINYLQQGLQLSERVGDGQSKALCCSSLGIALLIVEQPQEAIKYLESGLQAAQFSGDLYLQGRNLAYLSEAHYSLQNIDKTILTGSLGMYLLEQIAAEEWRKTAGLLTILQGQMGAEAFQKKLQQSRPQIIALIGVDGYDYIPQILEQYKQSM
ncbi:tetratricopeptide repeat protein [Coleofasciculus sp. FACHB-542]|uniref:tetratricopeptide repeat protein n=1 Tax=Coleofasciculus sp. FACHB-542 TaxID=2692787 RepID=UPI0016856EB0|nr:tetratricopeptide repeat protein [Coleofasciculus sp. FACHB-542]MBD2084121.1 tetratricopeptide repeat protein [Coleofasciculus sp. FACHB-542]